MSETVSRKSSNNSLDSNWIIGNANGVVLRNHSGTDSVRSATIRRSGVPNRGSIPFRGKDTPDQRGGIPVMTPIPPGATKKKLQKQPSIPLGLIIDYVSCEGKNPLFFSFFDREYSSSRGFILL